MRRKTAVILGVSGAALALTASSAFTAGGVSLATGVGFLGGSAAVTVTGTEIRAITYNADANDSTLIDSIKFSFSDHNANGKTPTIAIGLTSGTSTGWTCAAIASSTGTGQTNYSESLCSEGQSSADVAKTNLATVTLTVS